MLVMGRPRKHAITDAGDGAKGTRSGRNITLNIAPDIHESLNLFMEAQRVRPGRTDTVELALQEFLSREGFYPPGAKNPTIPSTALVTVSPGQAKAPILGDVAAGEPIVMDERSGEWFDFRQAFCREGFFLLKVLGTSMVEDHILPGDLIVVREQPEAGPGETVVAVLDDQVTVKRLLTHRPKEILLVSVDGKRSQYRLIPERGDRVIGVLVGVVRKK